MSNRSELEAATDRFFMMHWNSATVGSPPQWSQWKPFLYSSVPNWDKAGCYAMFVGGTLVYIGSGVSQGGGSYPNHGLSRRLTSNYIAADQTRGKEGRSYAWSRMRSGYSDVDGIATIGMPHAQAYLGLALENFLIREFRGKLRNRRV